VSIASPDWSKGLTGLLTSMTLGNVIRYYYDDPINTTLLPAKCIIFASLSIICSIIFLTAGFKIIKYVSSIKFNSGGTFSVGRFSICVENLPLDLKEAEPVFFIFFYFLFLLHLFI
jgi:hypothetical protein